MTKYHLDVRKILNDAGVDYRVLAPILFPKVLHPVTAFKRIIDGKAELSSSQVALLADYLGKSVSELFPELTSGTNPSFNCDDTQVSLFFKGGFVVLIDTSSPDERWEAVLLSQKDKTVINRTLVLPNCSVQDLIEWAKTNIQDWLDFA